jgi:hypothetical protein
MATRNEILVEHIHKEIQGGWGPLLADVADAMNNGHYDQHWVDFVVQKFGINANRTCYDVYDAYVFAQVYSGLHLGKIGFVKIPVGDIPCGNTGVMSNNIALSNVPAPFLARFVPEKGRGAIDDGFLKWDRPIALNRMGHSSVWALYPGRAPLEVGYTRPYTTLFHLTDDRALARWPYGSKLIYLLKVQDRELWNLSHPRLTPGAADG